MKKWFKKRNKEEETNDLIIGEIRFFEPDNPFDCYAVRIENVVDGWVQYRPIFLNDHWAKLVCDCNSCKVSTFEQCYKKSNKLEEYINSKKGK